jgi:hypothetical protein
MSVACPFYSMFDNRSVKRGHNPSASICMLGHDIETQDKLRFRKMQPKSLSHDAKSPLKTQRLYIIGLVKGKCVIYY